VCDYYSEVVSLIIGLLPSWHSSNSSALQIKYLLQQYHSTKM